MPSSLSSPLFKAYRYECIMGFFPFNPLVPLSYCQRRIGIMAFTDTKIHQIELLLTLDFILRFADDTHFATRIDICKHATEYGLKYDPKASKGNSMPRKSKRGFWPYDKVIADTKISMAGVLSQKIICGRGSRGCDGDLQKARIDAYNMFNMCGFSSCWETLPILRQGARVDTSIKRRRMERKIESLLKRCEKETIKYIKEHKLQISLWVNFYLRRNTWNRAKSFLLSDKTISIQKIEVAFILV